MITDIRVIRQALAEGAIVITPNNRLSNQLLQDYFHANQHQPVLEKPKCLPYQSFLKFIDARLRHQTPHIIHPILLSATQSSFLWQQVLRQASPYCYHTGLLKEVESAWTHCRHWQISPDDSAYAYTPQTQQFQHWQQLFFHELKKRQAITEAQLVDYFESQTQHLPQLSERFIWVCFDDFTPQQKSIQTLYAKKGVKQEVADWTSARAQAFHYQAKDNHDEWEQMALWAQHRLQKGDQRILIVVPDLQQVAPRLQRFLRPFLSSETYNLSLGKHLLQYPLITHALQWLKLNETLSQDDVYLLLHSPYLSGHQKEYVARVEWFEAAERPRESTISRARFSNISRTKTPELAALLDHIQPFPNQASIHTWVNLFKQRLIDIGFPGDITLDSESYQCFQRLMSLLDELLSLAFIQESMTREEALFAFESLAKHTIFQYQQPDTSIIILGLLEASGCQADSIWVCGLTDQCLPQSMRLSAFIPKPIQQQHDMPHASNERELRIATQLITRLHASCHNLIVSHPHLSGDQPNLPSPYITTYAPYTAREHSNETCPALLQSDENYQLPLAETEKVTGGSALLANQAQCPFKAFATHRLHARPIESTQEGLDARDRGQLIHNILEKLWRTLKNQDDLLQLSEDKLENLLKTLILEAFDQRLQTKNRTYPPLLKKIEIERLLRLLSACIEWEKVRPPFQVLAVEKTATVHLGGLTVDIRLDRIDELQPLNDNTPQTQCVIDYKTSIPSIKPWREDRPDAPQLLLYALTNPDISALLFLQLKQGHATAHGISADDIAIKGVQPIKKDEDWAAFQTAWHQRLTAIAEEFTQGNCRPLPISTSTCQWCAYQSLCRSQWISEQEESNL